MFKIGDIVSHKDDNLPEAKEGAPLGIILKDTTVTLASGNPYRIFTVHWFQTGFATTHGTLNLTLVSPNELGVV